MSDTFNDRKEQHAKGWAVACRLFKMVLLTREQTGMSDSDMAIEFMSEFECLRVIYGDPNAPKIEGVMDAKHK